MIKDSTLATNYAKQVTGRTATPEQIERARRMVAENSLGYFMPLTHLECALVDIIRDDIDDEKADDFFSSPEWLEFEKDFDNMDWDAKEQEMEREFDGFDWDAMKW